MKRVVVAGALGALALLGCSTSSDPASDTSIATTDGSVIVKPRADVVVTADQAATLIGRTEAGAEAYANDKGWVWRVGRRDGEQFMLTQDYCECRVTVSIDNSIVTDAVVG